MSPKASLFLLRVPVGLRKDMPFQGIISSNRFGSGQSYLVGVYHLQASQDFYTKIVKAQDAFNDALMCLHSLR